MKEVGKPESFDFEGKLRPNEAAPQTDKFYWEVVGGPFT
jgi:hypothetical protein